MTKQERRLLVVIAIGLIVTQATLLLLMAQKALEVNS